MSKWRYGFILCWVVWVFFPASSFATLVPGGEVLDATRFVSEKTTIRLGGVVVPNGCAAQAKAFLQRHIPQQMVRIARLLPEADRRGQIVAAVYDAQQHLLQAQLIAEGLGLWDASYETKALAALFLAAEAEAARKGKDCWRREMLFSHQEAAAAIGHFAVIEGVALVVAKRAGNWYVNFGEDWRTDFTLMIAQGHKKDMPQEWLSSLAGQKIRVRGYVFSRAGAAIALSHPQQVEVMP